MNFSCENCSAEYRVEDSKIGPLGIRVNCKKCSNIITVHSPGGPDDENVEADEAEHLLGQDEATLVMESSDFQEFETRTFSAEDINDIEVRAQAQVNEADVSAPEQAEEAQGGELDNALGGAAEHTVVSHFDPPTEAFTAADIESLRMRAEQSQSSFAGQDTMQMPVGSLDTGKNLEALALASLAAEQPEDDFNDAADESHALKEHDQDDSDTSSVEMNIETQQWYVAIDGEQIGPMQGPTLQARWLAQEIDEESLVWSVGMPDWVPVVDVPALAAYLGLDAGAVSVSDGGALNLAALRQDAIGESAPESDDDFAVKTEVDGDTLVVPETYGDTQVTAIGSDLSDLVEEEIHAAKAQDFAADASSEFDTESSSAEIDNADVGHDEFEDASPTKDTPSADLSQGWAVPKKSIPQSVEHSSRLTLVLIAVVLLLSSALVFVLLTRPSASEMDTAVNKRVDAVLKKVHQAKAIKPIKPVKKDQANQKTLALEPIVENIEAAQNALTLEQIISTVKDYQGDVQACFEKSYGRQQIEGGSYRLTMDWLIGVNGRVSEAKIKGPDKILVSNIPACVSDRMLLWQFPPAKTPSPVSNFTLGPIAVP